MSKEKNQSKNTDNLNIFQSIGFDLKESIDDLIYQVETIKDDVEKLKEGKQK